ncbi:MAG: BON domain-containing protein [Bryobacteraceae bacterium]
MKRARFAIALCALVGALAQTVAPKKPPPRPAPTATSASEDKRIENAIRNRLAASGIAADKFQVHVQGGVATLDGHTDVLQHKGTATRLAKSAGARQVANHIEVSDAAKEKASGNLAQGRRRAQLKRGDARSQAPN